MTNLCFLLPAFRYTILSNTQCKTQGLIKCLPLLNRRVFQLNKMLVLSIAMPLLVTYSHRLLVGLIWKYLVKAGPTSSSTSYASGQAYVFRISLLTVSLTTLAMILRKPARKISNKWMENVWESEFVVRRKLRNIDQVDDENETEGTDNGNGNGSNGQMLTDAGVGQGNDGNNFMRDVNGMMEGNEVR